MSEFASFVAGGGVETVEVEAVAVEKAETDVSEFASVVAGGVEPERLFAKADLVRDILPDVRCD